MWNRQLLCNVHVCNVGDTVEPFCLCKIKKLRYSAGNENPPTGAHVQWWDSSIMDKDHSRWVHDPWHCNAQMMDGSMKLDAYPILPASDFQAKIEMVSWKKPKDYHTKLPWGVKRMSIKKTDVERVQTYLHIWALVRTFK